MSTRTFWAIFTLSIIILVQLFFVKSAAKWFVSQELLSRNVTVGAVFPDENRKPAELEKPLVDTDLNGKSFSQRWAGLYRLDPGKTIRLTASLVVLGVLAGFLFASMTFRYLVKFGDSLSQLSTTDKLAAFVGGTLGILVSAVFVPLLRNPNLSAIGGLAITALCIWAAMGMKEELKFYWPSLAKGPDFDKAFQKPKILDTNVIIDGRISDICTAGFIEGQIFVPSFVLEELQHIADSSDSLRRARGRRGLDILNQMRKDLELNVRQCDAVDPANPEEVDVRLVKLAKEIDGTIVTNDFNLNKVAELQGVAVLNINELANALKPVVLPGEELTVAIIKEGKEMNQGVAYLDDGTMIVVEGAKRHIGETLDVVVTSVLQTVAGKMIFANLKTIQEEEDRIIDRNVRDYSGFRPRKKTFQEGR